jgi:hypothetical protein
MFDCQERLATEGCLQARRTIPVRNILSLTAFTPNFEVKRLNPGVLKHFTGLDSSLRGIILMAKPPDDQTFDRVVCLINDALKVN